MIKIKKKNINITIITMTEHIKKENTIITMMEHIRKENTIIITMNVKIKRGILYDLLIKRQENIT